MCYTCHYSRAASWADFRPCAAFYPKCTVLLDAVVSRLAETTKEVLVQVLEASDAIFNASKACCLR
jgi:hypothetical protein